MKINFDIKYRDKIESGEYKVETRDGKSARIICWDAHPYKPIVAYSDCQARTYFENGLIENNHEYDLDLFLVTPEEELTEWEKTYAMAIWSGTDIRDWTPEAIVKLKKEATTILDLARKYLNRTEQESVDVNPNTEKLTEFEKKVCEITIGVETGEITPNDGECVKDMAYRYAKELLELVRKELNQSELTEFEDELADIINSWVDREAYNEPDELKRDAARLLSIARKELILQGVVEDADEIEKAYKNADEMQYQKGYEKGKADAKKDLQKAVEEGEGNNIPDWLLDKFQRIDAEGFKNGDENGRRTALKDLPKWKLSKSRHPNFCMFPHYLVNAKGYEIKVSDLDKLPKENSL